MTRLVLFGAIAFVVGIAGGTGFVAMRPSAKTAAGADSSHAAVTDSAAIARDSTTTLPAGATATATTPAAAARESGTVPPIAAAAAAAPLSPAPAAAAAASRVLLDPIMLDGDALADSCRAVAKILSTMKPADAAKILNHLSDDQVEGILRASGARQAGVFMAQLPPERAAIMSRRFITRPQGAAK